MRGSNKLSSGKVHSLADKEKQRALALSLSTSHKSNVMRSVLVVLIL